MGSTLCLSMLQILLKCLCKMERERERERESKRERERKEWWYFTTVEVSCFCFFALPRHLSRIKNSWASESYDLYATGCWAIDFIRFLDTYSCEWSLSRNSLTRKVDLKKPVLHKLHQHKYHKNNMENEIINNVDL